MLFEHLAATDESHRVAGRKAVSLARARAEKRFARFIQSATSVTERDERLALVAGELEELVKQACADCDYQAHENVLATVQEHLGYIVEARRPKMCPYHREVMDISLAAGEPQAGFGAMAQHAWGQNHCQGEWEGGCNFKPEMTTQTYWDQKAERAEQRRQEREQQRQLEMQQPEQAFPEVEHEMEAPDEVENFGADETSAVGMGAEPAVAEPQVAMAASRQSFQFQNPDMPCPDCGGRGGSATGVCPSCRGTGRGSEFPNPHQDVSLESLQGTPHEVRARTAEALKTVDVEQGSEGPSPKMDKRKWTPENVSFLDDTEGEGSPHPTVHQDIAQPAQYKGDGRFSDDGRFDQTDAVLEKQDVEKSSNPTDGGGPATSTWPKGNQAKPVTSGVLPEDYEEARQAMSQIKQQHGPSSQGGDIEKYKAALAEFNDRYPTGPPKTAAPMEAPQRCGYCGSPNIGEDKFGPVCQSCGTHQKNISTGPRPRFRNPSGGPTLDQIERSPTAAVDPDRNPIAELISEEEAQRAVAAYKNSNDFVPGPRYDQTDQVDYGPQGEAQIQQHVQHLIAQGVPEEEALRQAQMHHLGPLGS